MQRILGISWYVYNLNGMGAYTPENMELTSHIQDKHTWG